MYHDFEVKYHDFGLPIVKSMLFFSNVRTFANRQHPSVRMESTGWATNAQS